MACFHGPQLRHPVNMQHQVSSVPKTQRISGKRVAIALVSWVLAAPGILFLVMAAGAALVGGDVSAITVLALASLGAWVSLAVMTVRWLQDCRCCWLWPAIGTTIGAPLAIVSAPMLVYLPAVPLATYLVLWHLKPDREQGSQAALPPATPDSATEC